MLKRFILNLMALSAGRGLQIVSHALLPPLFLTTYGAEGYGRWLSLSAAVGYLSLLDFGIQTYLVNELTLLYQQSDHLRFRRLHDSGFVTLALVCFTGSLFLVSILFLPIERWLTVPSAHHPRTALFFIAIQFPLLILFGYLNSIHRIVGEAHKGTHMANLQQAGVFAVTGALVLARVDYVTLASGQVLAILAALILLINRLWRVNSSFLPGIAHAQFRIAREIIGPSAFYALFVLNNFLLYQVPLLLINTYAGATMVSLFSITRTVFSFSRQLLSTLQAAIAPEITRIKGVADQVSLERIYQVSEAVMVGFSYLGNFVLLAALPLLEHFWLRGKISLDVGVASLFAVGSMALSIKEYKMNFQYSTNSHEFVSVVSFFSYLSFAGSLPFLLPAYGIRALLVAWIIVELIQVWACHIMNERLLDRRLSIWPPFRGFLTGIVTTCVVGTSVSLYYLSSIPVQAALAAAVSILLVCVALGPMGLWGLLRAFSRNEPLQSAMK